MKIIVPFSIILVATAVSCSSDNSKTASKTVKKTNIIVKTNTVKANKMLTVNIDGMVCEKGCGSSIRKELLHTDAVESCEFDFQTDRKTNVVKIAFDKDKITADKIISILNTMNEKQFKVIDTTTSAFESKNETKINSKIEESQKESNTTISKDEAKIEMSDSTIDHDAPNLLQVFSRLITG
ncbi:MAG: heavy-metal-associated domain-containing protein [Flavobacteriia bacterium]|jgi:vacuolar-type H+-ATPase subunit I/STV1